MILLIFTLDDRHVALHIDAVEKVYRAAAITPLPTAPGIVSGIIDIHGKLLPVINIRKRFRLPEKPLSVNDSLIVARTTTRLCALLVNRIIGVAEYGEADMTPTDAIVPGLEQINGVLSTRSGLILVHNPDQFLSLEEERFLETALSDRDEQIQITGENQA